MDRLINIKKKHFSKILEKQKEQQLKGGGSSNSERRIGVSCPPPFEPNRKK